MRATLLILLFAGSLALPASRAQENPLPESRAFEPVVLTGDVLAPLAGATPERVAAFRFRDGAWEQVPVQVDERERIDIAWAYNGRNDARCGTPGAWCAPFSGEFYTTVYMDEGTFVGADADPFVDADDEVVFMARDAGAVAPAGTAPPPGVLGSDGVQVRLRDPLGPGLSFVYLFWHDGRYASDAGRPYVDYRFRLGSGDYRATYNLEGDGLPPPGPQGYALGANPEDTEVETAYYRRHFSDRWIEDGLSILADGATGVDLLDRHKIQIFASECGRTEFTGSAGRGAFVTNRAGPVRAIRSVIGFNSGPLVQGDHVFYERYAVSSFTLRVHSVGGGLNYLDYSEGAEGMYRYSNLDPEGLVVDGSPDTAAVGPLEWEVMQGPQGTMVTAYDLATNIPGLSIGSYYLDEAPTESLQCTGDAAAIGASGPWLQSALPNTDPLRGEHKDLQFLRHALYAGPATSLEETGDFVEAVRTPLAVQDAAWAIAAGSAGTPGAEGPLRLGPPRPNPSATVARITYRTGEAGYVTLALYDALGRRVAVLDEGSREAGMHDVPIDPARLPAGLYVIRLITPEGVRTRTFVRP